MSYSWHFWSGLRRHEAHAVRLSNKWWVKLWCKYLSWTHPYFESRKTLLARKPKNAYEEWHADFKSIYDTDQRKDLPPIDIRVTAVIDPEGNRFER